MRRETVELDGPYYGRDGFWSYSSSIPALFEARRVAFEVSIDRQDSGKFKVRVLSPVNYKYRPEEQGEFDTSATADNWARNWLRRNCRSLVHGNRLRFVDNTKPFSPNGWKNHHSKKDR